MKISNQKLVSIVRKVLNETDMLYKGDMLSKIKDDLENTGPIVGSDWASCRVWNSAGKSKHGNKFSFVKSPNVLEISYEGPSSGLLIAHSQGGTDTIHQVFNVLICELNPYLAKIKAKPLIDDISYETWTVKKENKNYYGLSVIIPLEKAPISYQLNRRGGWGHPASDGKSKMKAKCNQSKLCEGPVTKKFTGKFGTITEHIITLPL